MLFEYAESPGWLAVGGSSFPTNSQVAWYDTVGHAILHYENVSKPFDFMGDIGHPIPGAGISSMRTFYGTRPEQDLSRLPEGQRRWAQYISHVRSLFTNWSFATKAFSTNEKPVSHFNVFGSVGTGLVPALVYRPGFMPAYPEDAVLPHYTFRLDGDGLSPTLVPLGQNASYSRPIGSLFESIGWFADEVNAGIWDYGQGTSNEIVYRNFRYEVEKHFIPRLMYSYSTRSINPVSGITWLAAYAVRFEFFFVRTPQYVGLSTVKYLSELVSYRTICSADALLEPYGYPSDEVPPVPWGSEPHIRGTFTNSGLGGAPFIWDSMPYFNHEPSQPGRFADCIGYNLQTARYDRTTSASFMEFRDRVIHVLPDCFPTAFLSTKDAVDEHFERMRSNHLEALAEVGDLFRVLDVFKALYELRKRPARGLPFLLRLLGIAADAKLSYSLGIAPTISDALDVAKRSSTFLKKYGTPELFGEHTVYGKATVLIPELIFPGFEDVVVVARSKIRVSVEPDSYLTAIIPVRSLGLLPSLSSLWDLIPFSFVVDWFASIGDHLDDVDTAAMLLAMNTHMSVHSISIIYRFTAYDEETFNFDVLSDGPNQPGAGYKYYDRFVLNELPQLGPTRLPLHGTAGVPDWGTAGALVFKAIT